MAYITLAEFQDLADSISAQYDALLAANAASDGDDVRTGAAANQGRVVALSPDLVEALIAGANATATQAVTVTKSPVTVFGDLMRGLNRPDVLGVNGIDAFLTAEAGEVTTSFAALFALVFAGQTITPANIDAMRPGAL